VPSAEYVAAVLATTPRAYYQCQEAAGLPQDSSGNGLHMTAGSATTYRVAGPMSDFGIRIGGGQGFTRASISAVVNNLAMMAWLNPVAITGDGQHLLCNHSGSTGYVTFLNQTLKWQNTCLNVAAQSASVGTLAIGTWKHIVVVRDAGTWKYYLNGAIDTANAGTSAPIAPASANNAIQDNAGFLDCRYAHVSFHDTVLTAATIAAIYAAGVPQTPADEGGSRLRVLGLV
jgi:hypothetical protein